MSGDAVLLVALDNAPGAALVLSGRAAGKRGVRAALVKASGELASRAAFAKPPAPPTDADTRTILLASAAYRPPVGDRAAALALEGTLLWRVELTLGPHSSGERALRASGVASGMLARDDVTLLRAASGWRAFGETCDAWLALSGSQLLRIAMRGGRLALERWPLSAPPLVPTGVRVRGARIVPSDARALLLAIDCAPPIVAGLYFFKKII